MISFKYPTRFILEGALDLRKFAIVVVTFCLLLLVTFAAYAEGEKPLNEVVMLANDEGFASGKFYVTDKFSITGVYEDELFKAGLRYEPSDRFAIKIGEVYKHDTEDTFTYGGIDFVLPFGNSLNIVGLYDSNYKEEDWDRYEAALKIQMFKNHYIYAGVRGDTGDGVPVMKYNEEHREGPHLFLRGDFSWYWKKASLSLTPLLYVKGYYYHDYTFKYHLKENANILLNINNFDNTKQPEMNYRAGLEFKF